MLNDNNQKKRESKKESWLKNLWFSENPFSANGFFAQSPKPPKVTGETKKNLTRRSGINK